MRADLRLRKPRLVAPAASQSSHSRAACPGGPLGAKLGGPLLRVR